MKDEFIDKEILEYITKDGKLVPQRCTAPVIEKRGWSSYMLKRYIDNSTNSIAEAVYRLYNNIEELPKCGNPECNNRITFNMSNKTMGTYCCPKCRNTSPEMIEKNRAGVSRSMKKAYEERGEEIKEKRAKTLKENYNSDGISSSPFSIKEVRNKIIETNNERYGVNSVMCLKEYHKNAKEVSRDLSKKLWKERGLNIEYTDKDTVIIYNGCSIHGDVELSLSDFNNRTKKNRIIASEICPICNKLKYFSGEESAMAKFLTSIGVEYIANTRSIISPDELDFYIPSKNVAIEMNGTFFHSELNGKDKEYHKSKSDRCDALGIQLIHVWEDEWVNNNDLIRSMLANKLNAQNADIDTIYARNCEFDSDVPNEEMRDFLNENHLQGSVNAKYKFGLRYNGELVAVMTFGSTRIALGGQPNDTTVELLRMCGKKWSKIVGGASKMFDHARDILLKDGKKEIITYAKRDWSDGSVYKILGFEFLGNTAPGYFYINKSGNKLNRFSCRKSIIANTEEEKNMTEVEIMNSRGYYRCFDSGNLKYKYTL